MNSFHLFIFCCMGVLATYTKGKILHEKQSKVMSIDNNFDALLTSVFNPYE